MLILLLVYVTQAPYQRSVMQVQMCSMSARLLWGVLVYTLPRRFDLQAAQGPKVPVLQHIT